MSKALNLKGQRFGRLVAIERIKKKGSCRTHWRCICDCGNEAIIYQGHLRNGHTQSCGCLQAEGARKRLLTHGLRCHSAYQSWADMISRCEKINNRLYKYYGQKGIKVCERWHKIENFIKDMGDRLPGFTLERKDNSGNYEPINCVWATRKQQGNNRSSNRLITYKGITKTLAQWAEIIGIQTKTLQCRLDKWTVEKSFTKSINVKSRNKTTKKFSQIKEKWQ